MLVSGSVTLFAQGFYSSHQPHLTIFHTQPTLTQPSNWTPVEPRNGGFFRFPRGWLVNRDPFNGLFWIYPPPSNSGIFKTFNRSARRFLVFRSTEPAMTCPSEMREDVTIALNYMMTKDASDATLGCHTKEHWKLLRGPIISKIQFTMVTTSSAEKGSQDM